MKKYVYNVFSGGYDTPVFECKMILHSFIGCSIHCHGTKNCPDAFMYFEKVVEDDEP